MGTGVLVPILFFAVLCVAAVQDIRAKEVDDRLHIIIAAAACIGFRAANLPGMLLGAVAAALPLLIAALVKPNSVGGADIKLMAASGLILGAGRGIIALVIGLTLGVVSTTIFRKRKKTDLATSFPLVPFLAAGCIAAYLLF